MKSSLIISILAIFAILSISHASEDDVLVLTDDTFDSEVNDEEFILVEFYAPWCGHCKKLAPNYEEAAGILAKNDPPIKLAKVDCTVETKVCGRFGVSGYPTLKVFRNGVPTDFKGARETSAIVSYMKKNAGPSARTLSTAEQAKKFITYPNDLTVVGFYPTKNADAQAFLKVADSHREDFKFGYISEQSVATSIGLSKAGVAVFRGSEKDPSIHTTGDLVEWLFDESVSVPGEITKDNTARWNRKGLPILKLYTDVNWGSNLKQTNYYLNRLKKIAEDTFKGKLLFALADRAGFSEETAKFGLTSFPSVGIDDHVNSQKYRHNGEFSIEKVVEFAKDFVAGKLKSYIKSEPTPVQDGPVTIVTGENFKDIVLDNNKDVLLEMYAPWCGHCKNLIPVYDELATNLKDVENLVIAKMDATANDSPHGKYQAKGFPTIVFAPAGGKDEPIAYSGARDVKTFTEFLKQNAKGAKF